jgi:glycosyltransferase involved in cell wall biosynthesis
MSRIAALIPCRDEEVSIAKVISDFLANENKIDVFVIDNGSLDATAIRAREAGATVVNCPSPGKSRAIRVGIKYLNTLQNKYDAIVMVDGDGTYDLSNLSSAIGLVVENGFDTAIGIRVISAESKLAYRRGHEMGNRVLTGFFNAFFPVRISDTLSGYRVMSPQFLNSFVGFGQGFEVEAELNAHIYALDASVAEFPCGYSHRADGSESKLKTYSDGIRIFLMLFWLFRTERPKKVFTFLGLPFLFIGLFLDGRALNGYLNTHEVHQFPSLIAGSSSILVFAVLYVSGIILQGIRQIRIQNTRRVFLKG